MSLYPFNRQQFFGSGLRFLDAAHFGFNGQERTDEIAGTGNHNTALFWEYDTRLGRRWNLDPVVKPFESSYATFSDNPIWLVDLMGDDPSTHTDKDGNVVEVILDGDKGVYKHNGDFSKTKEEINQKYSMSNTSAGGTYMGETEYLDEFVNPDTKEPDGTILFGDRESWDPLIEWGNDRAKNQDLSITMKESKLNKKLDIKNGKWASEGAMTGRLLNGKYATARSAGNFLAGLNSVTGTFHSKHISGETYMKLAGAYQVVGELSIINILRILIRGTSFGLPPYYGEEPYSGRRIQDGINAGNKMLGK